MRAAWSEAVGVLGRAGRFFLRHYPVVFGFGAVASIQRFLAVGGDEQFAFADSLVGELVTAATRVLFVLWLAWRLFADRDVPWSQVGERLGRFIEQRTAMLLISAGMLAVLTVIANVIPSMIGAVLPVARSTVEAWELAIKNVTVIPFVIVWLTSLARHALTAEAVTPSPERTS